jgi:hypothetical protein
MGFLWIVIIIVASVVALFSWVAYGDGEASRWQARWATTPLLALLVLLATGWFFEPEYDIYEVNLFRNQDDSLVVYQDHSGYLVNANKQFGKNFSKEVAVLKIKRRSWRLQGILPSQFYSLLGEVQLEGEN